MTSRLAAAPAGGPDLHVVSASARDDVLDPGQDLYIDLVVTNSGTHATRARTVFYWSPTESPDRQTAVAVDYDNHGTLRPGEIDGNEWERIRYRDLENLGSGWIVPVIGTEEEDGHGRFREIGPAVEVTLRPPGPADLHIIRATARDATLDPGQDLTIDLVVSNSGETAARGRTEFWWSPTDTLDPETAILVDHDNHGTLKPGEIDGDEWETIRYRDLADLGSGYVIPKIVDTSGSEHATADNLGPAIAVTLRQPAPADLHIDALRVSDTTVAPGQRVVVELAVGNSGETAMRARTVFWWSPSDVFDPSTALEIGHDNHGTLKPGEHDTDRFSVRLHRTVEAFGPGWVFAEIRARDGSAEAGDDTFSAPFRIGFDADPDLPADSFEFLADAAGPAAGEGPFTPEDFFC